MAHPSQIVAVCDTPNVGPSRSETRRVAPGHLRRLLESYCQVLAGTVGRLGLQAVYFFALANTLSLHDMGVFASTSAAGIMLGCFSGLGFSSIVFRAAAGRRRLLGGYLAGFWVAFAASLPAVLLAAVAIHAALFRDSIGLGPYLAVIVVEIAFWRIVEMIHQVNNGLGRYTAASTVIAFASAARTAAAFLFALRGGGGGEDWAVYYFVANGLAMLAVLGAYHPRTRLRWRPALFLGRLREAVLFAVSYFAFVAQSEVDKIIMLTLADERAAGIYAISMRIIDFTTVPFRTFYVLYSRKLIGEGRAVDVVRRGLRVEGAIALFSTLGFLALLWVLGVWPRLLGPNVSTAMTLFGVMAAVPAFKNLLEFHSELFFAYERMVTRAIVSMALVILKAAGIAALIVTFGELDRWGAWLNPLYGGLYLLSLVVVYRSLAEPAR